MYHKVRKDNLSVLHIFYITYFFNLHNHFMTQIDLTGPGTNIVANVEGLVTYSDIFRKIKSKKKTPKNECKMLIRFIKCLIFIYTTYFILDIKIQNFKFICPEYIYIYYAPFSEGCKGLVLQLLNCQSLEGCVCLRVLNLESLCVCV